MKPHPPVPAIKSVCGYPHVWVRVFVPTGTGAVPAGTGACARGYMRVPHGQPARVGKLTCERYCSLQEPLANARKHLANAWKHFVISRKQVITFFCILLYIHATMLE